MIISRELQLKKENKTREILKRRQKCFKVIMIKLIKGIL